MAPYDATANPYGGAAWQYIAANVRKKAGGGYALPDITARTPTPTTPPTAAPGRPLSAA